MNGSSANRVSPYLIVFASLLLAVFALRAAINPYMLDDALITFQYVRSAVEHGAPVWHEALPPVDGYTSLGHVLLLWSGVAAGFDIVLANTLVSAASMLLITALFLRQAAVEGRPGWAAGVGLAALLMNAGLVFWFSAGLETVLYAALFLLVYVRFEATMARRRLGFADAAALVALALVRPEGCFVAMALVAFLLLAGQVRRDPMRASLIPALAVLLAISGVFLWREWAYGHPFPNTYYAKVSASRIAEIQVGGRYALNWLVYFGGVLAAATALHTAINRRNYLRLLFVLGQVGLVVAAGGDPHPEMRFLLPIVPLAALDLAALLARPEAARRAAGILLLLAYLPLQFPVNGAIRLALVKQGFYKPEIPDFRAGAAHIASGEWPFVSFEGSPALSEQVGRAAGMQIGRLLKPDAKVGGADVGALAYFSRLPVLDANGLNHPVIAHLPKPADRVNVWGVIRFDEIVAEGADAINMSIPRYDDWSWRGVVEGGAECGYFARNQARLMEGFEAALAARYVCVSAPASDGGAGWLNILVDREKVENVFAIDATGLDITDCLPEFQRICGPG